MRISDWSSDVCSSDLLLGGALEKYHMLVGRPGMKGRHAAIGGVERDFVEPLPFVAQMIGIETRLHRQCHECTFPWLAVDLPLPALVPERGIITAHPATDDPAARCSRVNTILAIHEG